MSVGGGRRTNDAGLLDQPVQKRVPPRRVAQASEIRILLQASFMHPAIVDRPVKMRERFMLLAPPRPHPRGRIIAPTDGVRMGAAVRRSGGIRMAGLQHLERLFPSKQGLRQALGLGVIGCLE